MSQDISGFGTVANVVASVTFPVGFPITEFADDSDPWDSNSIQILDKGMGLNGDLLTWAKATPIPLVISVIPDSLADRALALIANNNRVSKGKASTQDVITITAVFPKGSTITYTGGKMTDAPFGNSIASAGRFKTKAYAFIFENKIGG